MNSEKWCSTARKLFTALTVIIVLLVFISAVIQAVALGEQDAGAAVWAFFIYMIGGCLGAAIWWFITRWLIFVLEELIEARKSREKLNKALFESFYRENARTHRRKACGGKRRQRCSAQERYGQQLCPLRR